MKKFEIVKSSREFNNIIKQGKYKKNPVFVLYSIDNNYDYSRFGITVPTKLGNAVTRNKLKRQLRSIIDQNKFLFKKSKDYIIIVRNEAINLTYQQMEEKLRLLVE